MKRLAVFLLILGGFLAPGVALAAPAGIFSGDVAAQRDHVDPIVSPGARSEHEHCFFGGTPVSTVETSEGLRGKATTMDVQTNHTAIWIPCVYENGVLLPQATQHGILVYYKPVAGTEVIFPEDFGSVTRRYGYRCGTGGGSFSLLPPATCDGVLVVTIIFEFPENPLFPTVQAYIRLNVGSGAVGNITLGGPVLNVDGAHGPETMHGDYMFGHDRAAYQRFLDTCVIPGRACGRNPVP
jgi:hypothetical protein